jgi:hypothetical protein
MVVSCVNAVAELSVTGGYLWYDISVRTASSSAHGSR